jgi:hypothetical protein
MVSGVPTLIKSITLVVALLTLGATVPAPANSLHADDCLAAPNSPAPEGSWWYYRLDWPTQRKCWYLRAPDRSLRRFTATTAAPLRSTGVRFGHRHSIDSLPTSVDPSDTASSSSRVDLLPVKTPTSEAITGTIGKLVQQSAQQGSAPPPTEAPASQATPLSQPGNEAGGRLAAPTTGPDPAPEGAAVQAQHVIAIPTNTAADSTSDVAERAAGGSKLANDAGISLTTILAVLALGLLVLCLVAKNVAMRWLRTIVNRRGPNLTDDQYQWRGAQDQRGSVDERQLIVSVLSDHSPLQNDDVPFQIAVEISKRKDKLARLHQNLDRLLQSPTAA